MRGGRERRPGHSCPQLAAMPRYLCWSMGEMNATSFSAHVLDSCSGKGIPYTHSVSTALVPLAHACNLYPTPPHPTPSPHTPQHTCTLPASYFLSHPLLTPPPHPTSSPHTLTPPPHPTSSPHTLQHTRTCTLSASYPLSYTLLIPPPSTPSPNTLHSISHPHSTLLSTPHSSPSHLTISFTPMSHPHSIHTLHPTSHTPHPTSHTPHSPHSPLHHYQSRRTVLSYLSRHSQTEQLPGIAPPLHSRCYSAVEKHLIWSKQNLAHPTQNNDTHRYFAVH